MLYDGVYEAPDWGRLRGTGEVMDIVDVRSYSASYEGGEGQRACEIVLRLERWPHRYVEGRCVETRAGEQLMHVSDFYGDLSDELVTVRFYPGEGVKEGKRYGIRNMRQNGMYDHSI